MNESDFWGSSETGGTGTSDRRLGASSARVQVFEGTTTPNTCRLPDIMTELFQRQRTGGRPLFILKCDRETEIRAKDNTLLHTTAAGNMTYVFVLNNASYVFMDQSLTTPRSYSDSGELTTPPAPVTTETIEQPPCFDPYRSDCDYLEGQGLTALDGLEGRDLVVIPTFQDPIYASNSLREPVRCRDIVMPSVLGVTIDPTQFAEDAAHPLAGSYTLSQAFFNALLNRITYEDGTTQDLPIALEYDRTLSSTTLGTLTSEHWHHIRREGLSSEDWELDASQNPIDVRRHVWRKQIAYNDGTAGRTVDIRLVIEHCSLTEPTLDAFTASPLVEREGHIGCTFNLYVFTDEINPSFVDDSTLYTAPGMTGGATFNRANPARWGSAASFSSLGGSDAEKFCHPQLALHAFRATTMERPIGKNWVPIKERQHYTDYGKLSPITGQTSIWNNTLAENQEAKYLCGNGAPWVTVNSSPNTITDQLGIRGNIVFGGLWSSQRTYRAMPIGFDFDQDFDNPPAQVGEFWLWANGPGDGHTFLQPTGSSGWTESSGEMTGVAEGLTITACSSGDDWAESTPAAHACLGHPTNIYTRPGGASGWQGAGAGSHRCIASTATRTPTRTADPVFHMISPKSPSDPFAFLNGLARLDSYEPCQREKHVFTSTGNPPFCNEDLNLLEIEHDSILHSPLENQVEDYDLNLSGLKQGSITFARYLPSLTSPGASLYNHATDHPNGRGTWNSEEGTFDYDDTSSTASYSILCTAIGTDPESEMVTSLDLGDGERYHSIYMTARASVGAAQKMGIGKGYYLSAFGLSGIFCQNFPTGVSNEYTFEIVEYRDGTKTSLASVTYTQSAGTSLVFEFTQHGCDVTAKVTMNGSNEQTLTAHTFDFSNLLTDPIIYGNGPTAAAFNWDQITVRDLVPAFVECGTCTMSDSLMSALVVEQGRRNSYGKCDGWNNAYADCGLNPNCDCVNELYFKTSVGSFSQSSSVDLEAECTVDIDAANPTRAGGGNPAYCYCEGLACDGSNSPCGENPEPFRGLAMRLKPPKREDLSKIAKLMSDATYQDWVDGGMVGTAPAAYVYETDFPIRQNGLDAWYYTKVVCV